MNIFEKKKIFIATIIYKFLEPVGSVSPKISIGEDLKHVKGKQNQGLSLLCPAQAYPQPIFR